MIKNISKIIFTAFLFFMAAAKADTNPAVYTEEKTAIMVTKDKPEFVIKLKSNPTTGYSWYLRDYNAALIEPVKQAY